MASKYRQSILLRPKKGNSRVNDENLDREYDKESMKAEAVAMRLQEVEKGMMKQIFPSASDKVDLQEQMKSEMEAQLAAKEQAKKQALIDELEHAAALQQHVQLTQYVEADHKAARREYLKHLMEQNKKLIDYREHVKTVEKKAEIEQDKARPDYHEVTWNRSTR
jgi:adenylate kinase family enzyme